MKNCKLWWTAIFILAAGLRVILIQTRSIQYDDAFSLLLSEHSFSEIIRGTAADTMPPLYYFILHLWMLLGNQIWWTRFLSVIINLLTLGFFGLLITRLSDERSGLIATFFAAISPLQIFHSQDIRMYALMELFLVIYFWMVFLIIQNLNKKIILEWFILIISGVCALYTHNLSILFIVIPNFILILKQRWNLLGKLILSQIIMFIAFIPWIIFLPGQLEKVQTAFWTPVPGVVEIIQVIIQWVAALPLSDFWLGPAIGISILALVTIMIEYIVNKKSLSNKTYLLSIIIIPGILAFVISYITRPIFIARGIITSSLFFYGLAGILVSHRMKKVGSWIILVCLLAGALIALPYQYTYAQFPRSPFQEAVTYLEANYRSGDIIIHDNKLSFFPCYFINRYLPQSFLEDQPGSTNDTLALETEEALNIYPERNLASAINGYDRIFYVFFTETEREYQSMTNLPHPSISWLDNNYTLISQRYFNDLAIYSYSRNSGN